MTEAIPMNMYHFDDTYKISPGTKDAWKVQRVDKTETNNIATEFLPKSECDAEEYPNGKVILNIPIWLINRHKEFFDRS